MTAEIERIQKTLKEAGVYEGKVDGVWGDMSQGALDTLANHFKNKNSENIPKKINDVYYMNLAWGAKVSTEFKDRILWICKHLSIDPNYLMACIAWESNETFSASVKNLAGSGATGLIQFMPNTAKALGTSVAQLAQMRPEDQLNYVYKYFLPYKKRLVSLSDVYMAILWPAAIGKAENQVLWAQSNKPTTYRQNIGLDIDKDGIITKSEASFKVRDKLNKGLTPDNRG